MYRLGTVERLRPEGRQIKLNIMIFMIHKSDHKTIISGSKIASKTLGLVMISTKQLIYALAVEKHLHFKKAAEACNISQSALSNALNELEKQLGVTLFERDNKKVLVTPLGQHILDKAREVSNSLADIKQLADSQKEPLSFPMSIGVIPTIGPYLLPRILPELTKTYPKLALQIIEDQSHVLVDMVRKGDIDTAILALPFPLEGLLSFEFWQEDFLWVTQKNDSLASRHEITSKEFNRESLLLLKDGHCLKDHAMAACKFTGGSQQLSVSATSLTTIMPMVAAGMGTTIVPEMALQQLVSPYKELRAIHLNETSPHRTIAFIVRPGYSGLNSIERLITLFKSALQKS
ncbi:transcriptional regulator, LysR family [Alteromonadaceae bacterium Bs31]|nr:transcriptional regulator, LysR family [Alteromonadaceae bacterium Bs31]